jgi:hypothetical protein
MHTPPIQADSTLRISAIVNIIPIGKKANKNTEQYQTGTISNVPDYAQFFAGIIEYFSEG